MAGTWFAEFINGAVSAYWALPSFIITLGYAQHRQGRRRCRFLDAQTIYSFPFAFEEFGSMLIYGRARGLSGGALAGLGRRGLVRAEPHSFWAADLWDRQQRRGRAPRRVTHVFWYKVAAFSICGL